MLWFDVVALLVVVLTRGYLSISIPTDGDDGHADG
jgi:hypothetical protein